MFLLVVLSLYHYTSNGATDEESIGPIIAVIWPRAYELQLTWLLEPIWPMMFLRLLLLLCWRWFAVLRTHGDVRKSLKSFSFTPSLSSVPVCWQRWPGGFCEWRRAASDCNKRCASSMRRNEMFVHHTHAAPLTSHYTTSCSLSDTTADLALAGKLSAWQLGFDYQ